jgi:hypothetical protein
LLPVNINEQFSLILLFGILQNNAGLAKLSPSPLLNVHIVNCQKVVLQLKLTEIKTGVHRQVYLQAVVAQKKIKICQSTILCEAENFSSTAFGCDLILISGSGNIFA